jgi:uncharacterized membrane protein
MKVFFAGLAAFVVMDAIWLGVLMTEFYQRQLSAIARTAPDGSLAPLWSAAIPVYLLVVLGVMWFVHPKSEQGGVGKAAMWGAAFGVVSFGIYDLTSLALLSGFSTTMAAVDIMWGGLVCATVAVAMRLVSPRSR